jgi:uncharacterized repeat protein (TIGR02543 family)
MDNTDINSCGYKWINNGFAAHSTSSTTTYGSCTSNDYAIWDNVYGSSSSQTVEAWTNAAITGHQGGPILVTVKTRLKDYYSPHPDVTSGEWGNMKVYYKSSLPSVSDLGTQVGSTANSSSDCQTHSFTATPGTTISNLYIAITNTVGSGDNRFVIDEVTVTEGYSITFDANGGSGSMDAQFISGSSALTSNSFTRTCYSFNGWNTSADGTGTSYANNASYNASANATLYAQWSADATAIIYVATTGNDASGNGSSGSPYATLAKALTIADCNDIIDVASGTYSDDLLDITSSHNGLSIRGAGMESTIFDQGNSGDGDHFMEIKSSATNITITDMKIMDYDEANDGGAVDINCDGVVTFQDVWFHNNKTTTSSDDGGAVYIASGETVTFDRCKFTNNDIADETSSNGGVVYSYNATTTFQNCLFYDNGSYGSDDGLIYFYYGTNNVINCTFADNSEEPIYSYSGGTLNITNCIFKDNTGNDVERDGGTVNFTYNWYEATTGTLSTNTNNKTSSDGNVNFVDQNNDDYRIEFGSYVKNIGTTGASIPAKDFAGNDRDGSPDMGCYEYVCSSASGGTAATSTATVCAGNTGSLTVTGHTAQAIKWQQSTTSDFSSGVSDVSSGSGETTISLTTGALSATTYYRVAASCDGSTYNAYSNIITITVPTGTKYVATNGHDTNNDGNSSGSPYLTLSRAISQAGCGYTINVAAGTYSDDLLDITSSHDGLTIIGAGMESTIFDQGNSGDGEYDI